MTRPAVVVYAAATLQGFAFTLVPALATVFTAAPYRIDAGAFGSLFVTLSVGAVLAAIASPILARAQGTVTVLRFGIVANVLALVALGCSVVAGSGAYALLLADTLLLGAGFGANVAAINELAATLSQNATRSITIANVLIGLGTALTPLFIGSLVARGAWPAWPALLVAGFAATFATSLGWIVPRSEPGAKSAGVRVPKPLLLFGAAAVLYALCEGAFSSWATTFARDDRGFTLETGETALSAYWFALTGTRAVAAILPARALPPALAVVCFPIAIAAAFLLLPLWPTPATLVLGFAFGGIACSVVFPYAVSLALASMPGDEDRTAAVMVAALIASEGLGTYLMGLLRTSANVTLPEMYRASAIVAVGVAAVALVAVRSQPKIS